MQTLGLMGCWVTSACKRFGHTMISGDTMWNHSSSARTTVVFISPFLSHLQCGKPTIACIQLSPSFWGMFDWFEPNSCAERLHIPQASFLESKLYSYGFVTVCPHMGYTQQCHSNWNICFKKNSKKNNGNDNTQHCHFDWNMTKEVFLLWGPLFQRRSARNLKLNTPAVSAGRCTEEGDGWDGWDGGCWPIGHVKRWWFTNGNGGFLSHGESYWNGWLKVENPIKMDGLGVKRHSLEVGIINPMFFSYGLDHS